MLEFWCWICRRLARGQFHRLLRNWCWHSPAAATDALTTAAITPLFRSTKRCCLRVNARDGLSCDVMSAPKFLKSHTWIFLNDQSWQACHVSWKGVSIFAYHHLMPRSRSLRLSGFRKLDSAPLETATKKMRIKSNPIGVTTIVTRYNLI